MTGDPLGEAPPEVILGVSAYYHNSAAALVIDGVPVAAAEEERFTRIKNDASFPYNAVSFCLDHANMVLDDVDAVVYYEDSTAKFRRVAGAFIAAAPTGYATFRTQLIPWLTSKRSTSARIASIMESRFGGRPRRTAYVPHHLSHAASAFYPSPYEEAAILCVDGVGESATTTIWSGGRDGLTPVEELRYPNSLGLLYSSFTQFCGFGVNSGEYKLMGLAPYGTPRYADTIVDALIDMRPDGSFKLRSEMFEFPRGVVMTGRAFERLFGGAARPPGSVITQRDCDLAASIQKVTEEIMQSLAARAVSRTGHRRLCLAGGVALNCVANQKISVMGGVDDVWVQPAAGDAGGALGCALAVARVRPAKDGADSMNGALLGPEFSDEHVMAVLDAIGARYETLATDELIQRVVGHLVRGRVVAWVQGRAEFGPRALGNRSILADPRGGEMQHVVNASVKFRESFRPFAPAVLEEEAVHYFDIPRSSPYMTMTYDYKWGGRAGGRGGAGAMEDADLDLLSVVHVDGTSRVQTVDKGRNPLFWRVLRAFHQVSGCPALLNTSFNLRGEPLVNDVRGAFRTFMDSGLDVLAVGSCLMEKVRQVDRPVVGARLAPEDDQFGLVV